MKINSLQELSSAVVVLHINKRNDIKHLEIPSQLKRYLFKIWKWYQMESVGIQHCIEEILRQLKFRDGRQYCLVVIRCSHEDLPPRIPGEWDYTTDPDYSYCFHCTKELNLPFDIQSCVYDLNTVGVINILGRLPSSFFGCCDNCMLPLYDIVLRHKHEFY